MKPSEMIRRYFTVHRCGGCREILDYEHRESGFCDDCMRKFSVAKSETCPICYQSAIECRCMPKGLSRSGALCLRKLCFYSAQKAKEPQNRIIYFMKKNRNRRMASFIASELRDFVFEELSVLGADEGATVIVNVPRTDKARKEYGFDQAELIADALSRLTDIPYVRAIKRKRGGKEQKKLTRSERFRNTESLFMSCNENAVSGKYVFLIDDIVTTGASMAACTKILQSSGAKAVICLCIAED